MQTKRSWEISSKEQKILTVPRVRFPAIYNVHVYDKKSRENTYRRAEASDQTRHSPELANKHEHYIVIPEH